MTHTVNTTRKLFSIAEFFSAFYYFSGQKIFERQFNY